jgi:hypothetical protein
MRGHRVSGKIVIATLLGELLLIFLAAYWYAGTPGWGHGDEGRPSVTVHFQFTPRAVPLTRSYPT